MYKNIYIISDSIPNKNGRGISQTLFNLFDKYPGKLIVLDTEVPKANESGYVTNHFQKIRTKSFKSLNNRFGFFFNPLLERLNLSILQIFKSTGSYKIEDNSILLVSTTCVDKLLYAYLLSERSKAPLICYFMDNWIEDNEIKWHGNSTLKLVNDILIKSVQWIMISENLLDRFIHLFKINSKPSLIIHNPVESSEPYKEWFSNEKFIITYAGSIWPMHADALLHFSDVITKTNRKVELHIYAPVEQWEKYKAKINLTRTHYMGYCSYDDLTNVLIHADAFLVTASFSKEYYHFSYSSVQTKITDYMRFGRPIITVAPEYSAVKKFTDQWEIGIGLSSCNIQKDTVILEDFFKNEELIKQMGKKAFAVLNRYFTKQIVQTRLYDFLNNCT